MPTRMHVRVSAFAGVGVGEWVSGRVSRRVMLAGGWESVCGSVPWRVCVWTCLEACTLHMCALGRSASVRQESNLSVHILSGHLASMFVLLRL